MAWLDELLNQASLISIKEELLNYGVECPEDIIGLEQDDIVDLKLKQLQVKKLKKLIDGMKSKGPDAHPKIDGTCPNMKYEKNDNNLSEEKIPTKFSRENTKLDEIVANDNNPFSPKNAKPTFTDKDPSDLIDLSGDFNEFEIVGKQKKRVTPLQNEWIAPDSQVYRSTWPRLHLDAAPPNVPSTLQSDPFKPSNQYHIAPNRNLTTSKEIFLPQRSPLPYEVEPQQQKRHFESSQRLMERSQEQMASSYHQLTSSQQLMGHSQPRVVSTQPQVQHTHRKSPVRYNLLEQTEDEDENPKEKLLQRTQSNKYLFDNNFDPFKQLSKSQSETNFENWAEFSNDTKNVSAKLKIEELDFGGVKGESVLQILTAHCGNIKKSELIAKIKLKDLILQDQIGCYLKEIDLVSFKKVRDYLLMFNESKNFLNFRFELTIEEMERIREYSLEDIPKISSELTIVQSVIRKYMLQYELNVKEAKKYSKRQVNSLLQLAKSSKSLNTITINDYKKITTYSQQSYMDTLDKDSERVGLDKLYDSVTLLVFYCIKCRLPLDDITTILSEIYDSGIPQTNYELFQVIFQHSDANVKALCIDDYSFSSPVPFYYPLLSPLDANYTAPVFKICQELWFTFPSCLAVTSFGLGGANCRQIGKSFLLDKIFDTDFAETNTKSNPFHFRSIDVQITNNIQIEDGTKSSEEKKVAYFDCHGGVPLKVILTLCRYVNIIIIHVLETDMKYNGDFLKNDIKSFSTLSKTIIVFIRDCENEELRFSNEGILNYIYTPNVEKTLRPRALQKLKMFFRNLFNQKRDQFPTVDQSLVESVMRDLDDDGNKAIMNSKVKICKIITLIENFRARNGVDPEKKDFLCFYPIFVEYMKSYHKAIRETNQDVADQYNAQCATLAEKLENSTISPIISAFVEIFESNYSGLLLWRLSKYLTRISDENCTVQKYRYSIDILWREAVLSFKYENNIKKYERYTFTYKLNSCFSKQLQEGEPFELIDGDNLVFYSKDIDVLLNHFYGIQQAFNYRFERGKKMTLSEAPTVISIFGPQSSGKSTLLNYCFGCRFVTSAGRCTKGVYGSFFQMKEILNNSKTLLILDTEGLDAIEREESGKDAMLNFDRTLALFCLSVSQVVIINIRGDIGTEIKNLLQVCAYSLNRLKVNKVNLPKIFLVLNQQTNPNVRMHETSLTLLMESLNYTFYTADLERVKISDLIHITSRDLFVLPSAFNIQILDGSPLCNTTDSQALKLRSTKQFAQKCSLLRTAIFKAIHERDHHKKPPFSNISEWIQMAGLIWETCVKYQDIVMFRDLEEMAFSEKVREISNKLIDEEIYQKNPLFQHKLELILKEIETDENCSNEKDLLTDKVQEFDDIFSDCRKACESKFESQVRSLPMSGQFDLVYQQAETNLTRLIFVFRKYYEDKIKFRIHNVMLEFKIRDSMKAFQKRIEFRIDDYINFTLEEQTEEFEKIWKECYETEFEDDTIIRREYFEILYTNFRVECNFIEKSQSIFQLFRKNDFNMENVIYEIETRILNGLINSGNTKPEECFFCILSQTYGDFSKVEPHYSREKCEYLSPDSFVKKQKEKVRLNIFRKKCALRGWIPKECHPFVESCSGDLNNYEVLWGSCHENQQILLLSSNLRNPNDLKSSCWETLLSEVRAQAKIRLSTDPQLSQTTIKLLISGLSYSIKVVNHEIKYIRTMLSNKAERELSTLLFAYSFQEYWQFQSEQRNVDISHRKEKKNGLKEYFFQKIENRKMFKGNWDTNNMRDNDLKISEKFALDYLDSIKRYVLNTIKVKIEKSVEVLKESLKMENLLMKATAFVREQITRGTHTEITDTEHFVIQFICNRNYLLEKLFHTDWYAHQEKLKIAVDKEAKESFAEFVKELVMQFELLFNHFNKLPKDLTKQNCFFSDNNFVLHETDSLETLQIREVPFKAMGIYLNKYLNPMVSSQEMVRFFQHKFEVDGIKVIKSPGSILPNARLGMTLCKENFKRLENTNIFNSELIFNISLFISNFKRILVKELSNFSPNSDLVTQMFEQLRHQYLKDALGCDMQCPSCGKFCERGIHNDSSKCQILTGHQLSSMGGKVWKNDKNKTAILFMCDDYRDHMTVNLPEKSMKWSEFKLKCGNDWNWDLPKDTKYKKSQEDNRDTIHKIWTKFGKGILKYYSRQGTTISYIPFSLIDMNYSFNEYYICFVIDGTGSMSSDIKRARMSVSKIVKQYQKKGSKSYFRIVIYRDHCDRDIIETFPNNASFSTDSEMVMSYLGGVEAYGGGDEPEAMLDGLATAVTKTEWKNNANCKNIIVHIFDAPPHGDFPSYKLHSHQSNKSNCCCCNHSGLCPFDWELHVWSGMKKSKLFYHGINTCKSYPEYERTMKNKLGELCGEFQLCGKEQVDEAIMELFINFHM